MQRKAVFLYYALITTILLSASIPAAAQSTAAIIHLTAKSLGAVEPAKQSVAPNTAAVSGQPPAAENSSTSRLRTETASRLLPAYPIVSSGAARKAVALPKTPKVTALSFASGSGNANFAPFAAAGTNAYTAEVLNGGATPVEPPDQGMCVGNGKVIEIVNLVITLYDLNGNPQSGYPQNLSTFFQAGPGDFLSNPRCYYDPTVNAFFLSVTDLGSYPNPPNNKSSLIVAVLSGDGTVVHDYALNTTDDGSNGISHANCPCYEDQPLLGVDANGVYLSGNELSLNPANSNFNGGQIYAFNKSDLVTGQSNVGVTLFTNPITLAEGTATTVSPAISTDGVFATANNGTEYFMSALDFAGTRDNRIAVWALINTCGLASAGGASQCSSSPALLAPLVLTSNAYGVPPLAKQGAGNIPLGKACKNGKKKLDTGNDRMQQVVYANGSLYSAVTTVVTVSGAKHAGLLYFVVQPSVNGTTVGATISNSNYVAAKGLDLFYPSVAASTAGSAELVFSYSGSTTFPSLGYTPITANLGTAELHTAMPGVAPYDGISGYPGCNGSSSARWGDYSAAIATGSTFWMAGEYVSASCTVAAWDLDPTCVATRGQFSNWGTQLFNVTFPGA